MNKSKEEQRRCEGKLVCPACNIVIAQAEGYAATDERGVKYHNLTCLDKHQTQTASKKEYAAGRIQQTQSTKNLITV